jgi:hypothetical protein
MPVRTTSKDTRGFGSSKVLDSHSLEFLSTRRTGGGTNEVASSSPSYVTSNLLMYVDASKSSSYSGSGTTWYDLSGNGKHLSLTNGPTFVGGSSPKYFSFDGTNDEAGTTSITTFNNTNNVSGSLEGWVRISDTTGYRHIMGFRDEVSPYDNFFFLLLFDTPNTEAAVSINSSNLIINYNPGNNYWTLWKQIVFTFDRSDSKTRLYVNGSLVATSSGTVSGTFGTLGSVGYKVGGSTFYTQMDGSKFLVYNKALSSTEVSQNYNAFKSEFGLT